MERQRKWQFILILTVIAITIYNILPTIFYYLQPLKAPVSPAASESIAASIENRIAALEEETKDWLRSYCKLLQLHPDSITIDPEHPQFASISFSKSDEAARFRTFFPRAGSLIPFAPSQLSLAAQKDESSKTILVERKIPVRLQKEWFSYASKNDPSILSDRIDQIVSVITNTEDSGFLLDALQKGSVPFPLVDSLAAQINAIAEVFEDDSPIAARYAARFIPAAIEEFSARSAAVQTLIDSFDHARDAIRKEKARLAESENAQFLTVLEAKEKSFLSAEAYIKKHTSWFASERKNSKPISADTIDLSGTNPLFGSLSIDRANDQFSLQYLPEVSAFLAQGKNKNRFEQLLIAEAAKIGRSCNEDLSPTSNGIAIPLNRLSNTSGYLILDQQSLIHAYTEQVRFALNTLWEPKHPDLQNISVVNFQEFQDLPAEEQSLCILIGSPLSNKETNNLKAHAFYVIAKGIERIAKTYEAFPNSEWAQVLNADLRDLADILYRNGFAGYVGASIPSAFTQEGDLVFEKQNFSAPLLAATRETFVTRGAKKTALTELSDTEHRILTDNKIETQIHTDLLKWRDDYSAAQVSLDPAIRFDVPKPTKSVFWSNLALSARKYLRGDDRKILRWGLDLSGGKTIQIELQDANHQPVTNDADLKQGMNELYNRVNKMGVSEVAIRQVGHHIVLDFPGSQAMSATDLVKASTMVFHVVNEKYSMHNPILSGSVNRFLQEIWNEASVTGNKDPQSIENIAMRRLHPATGTIRSEAAQTLWENGLRLLPADGTNAFASSELDDSVSKVVLFRGDEPADWHHQNHPLLIVFRNWALEGASLENIRSGYDPSRGNFLSFEVSGIASKNALSAWTSLYSKESIAGTSLEQYSQGRGWRMAAILNGTVINAPTLESSLRDSAMISGSFSQREANLLAADLKAGSLTFTPHILSENNVSPELGKADKLKGITATFAALLLVIGAMIGYYRFAGAVASVAVIFNLLILWAVLQNLGAALTLAGLAGVILTVGMAVDANVLIFERIKEEFALTGRISSAIAAGYKKAYSAIIDSNVTTIIAALILLNFDAGPIKSFAVNLIIGIASSMFTALFMTRFYFTGWAKNPKNTTLNMANWIKATSFPFLRWSKAAFAVSTAIIVVGCSLICINRSSMLGMDFTGGYALNLELESGNIEQVERALLSSGASIADFQIRALDSESHLQILFGTTMEQIGKPFHQMPIETESKTIYPFEKNPRINWAVNALGDHQVVLSKPTLSQLHSNWTSMSGQMSDAMRNHAIIGLAISFVCIFIYLVFRFEYQFAAAALLCLFHDVLITFGCIGLLHVFGVRIQIDLNTIAALMTIIGYSLNDTIIIFDRIREDLRYYQKRTLSEVVNHALNATLSRTTITSGTTLLVLIALVALGGPSIFSFALVMTIGVFFGTISSWFIASPLMIFFHKREEKKEMKSVSL